MTNDAPSSSRLPTRHQLAAALRAGGVVDPDGDPIPDVRDSYSRTPSGGIFTVKDLIAGERLLVRAGLLTELDGRLLPTARLDSLLAVDPEESMPLLLGEWAATEDPLWLRAAAGGDTLRPELVPDDVSQILAEVIPDPDRREALLLALGRRAEADFKAAMGARGEEEVVAACRAELSGAGRQDLAQAVQRVSLISDQLGYDVTAPRLDRSSRRLEVKTAMGSVDILEIVLSRGEARVGLADSAWSLVICHIDREDVCRIVGWTSAGDIRHLLPRDPDGDGRWESARITLRPSQLVPDLPPIG